ncbi:TAXI family TRAP transporter solute-binding subunit [Chloroflexota bacterium]
MRLRGNFRNIAIPLLLVTLVIFGISCTSATAPTPSAPAAPAQPASPTAPAPATAPTAPSAPTAPEGQEVYRFVYGAGPPSSSFFLMGVAYIDIVNKYVPNVRVDQMVIPGTETKLVVFSEGGLIFAGQSAQTDVTQAYHALGGYADRPPMTNIRFFTANAPMALYFVVRADSDIYTMEDLNDKKVFAGAPGSSAHLTMTRSMEALGVNPEIVEGSYNDGVAAIKDRRVDAFGKWANGLQLDATMLDIQSFTPIRILGFTEEQMPKVKEASPGIGASLVKKGSIATLPDQPDFWAPAIDSTAYMNKDVPQWVAYEMFKAIVEHWDEVQLTFPLTQQISDPMQWLVDSLMSTAPLHVPLHPGVIQYLVEEGIEVPDALIPPEYSQ